MPNTKINTVSVSRLPRAKSRGIPPAPSEVLILPKGEVEGHPACPERSPELAEGRSRGVPRLLFLLITIYWLLSTSLYAAPCYGTSMPQKKQFFVGMQTHHIFKRNLEDEFGRVRSSQELILVSYGLYDWFSIDLKGGSGNIKHHPLASAEIDYPYNFAGGYGLRLRLYEREKIKMVFGFQHISVHPKSVHPTSVKNKAILDDWQVSLLGSYDFERLTPYLGTKWSRVDYIHRVGDDRKRRMSDLTKSWGLVFGFDVGLTKNSWINLEGHFFDEEAFALSLNFGF